MVLLRSSAFALMLAGLVQAAAVKRQTITALSSSQISSYAPFTHFASTAYCNPSTTRNWSCGSNCQANSDFQPVASGGDGGGTQFWYVGFSPSQNTVIVAHQGTDTSEFLADLTDANFFLESLDPSLFPGVPSSVEAHNGFADEHAKTAPTILSAVQQTLSAHGASSVTVVGHSLGAALSLLDGVYLRLHLSTGVTVRVVGYGMPRVGNQDFANWVDSHLGGHVTHINNREDPIPIVPGRFLGFHHASGEVHITDSGVWENCPGQDNTSTLCIVGDVSNIFEGSTGDHGGPYAGITMGC
ncbi:lipase class 3 family protein [Lactarius akahatsu]|uniref:Lipase class 3 family protein n=1 Tax=Lactarius akahatsu TaxID=416441 RepID=A0AAD4LHB3_9AGAM|nr:lipase class 3 family protein [Lactarius akahatsu]